MRVELSFVNNTPVFLLPDQTSKGGRIFGSSMNPEKTCWRLPAFPPFLDKVLHDLKVIYKSFCLSPDAEAHVQTFDEKNSYARAQAWKSCGPHNDYDHQTVGLGKLLHNYRYVLQWEMGTGKTKPIVELIKILGVKALVLCPLVAARNWVKEVTLHSGGTLNATAMLGTRSKKMKLLDAAQDVDVFVATYDTARLYGVPHITPAAQKLLKEKGILRVPRKLADTLKLTSYSGLQVEKTVEWLSGHKLDDIREEVIATVGTDLQWLSQLEGEIIVADESHRIKQISSQRTAACLRLASKFPRRYLLSGTLNLGDPRDLYPQMKFLAPYIIAGNYNQFCDNYVVRSRYNPAIVTGYKNLDKLNRIVTRVSDRKELNDCVSLPERTDEILYYDLTARQISDYNNAVDFDEIVREENEVMSLDNGAIRLNKLLQICSGFYYVNSPDEVCDTCEHLSRCFEQGVTPGSGECRRLCPAVAIPDKVYKYPNNPKLALLEDFLEDLLSAKERKVIIWANFLEELNDIAALLDKMKFRHVRLDGTTSKHVAQYENMFQTDPDCRGFLGQTRTGISITLTAAQYMVYYSRSWALEDWLQSRNRNYRIGQKSKTVVYNLCARNTVELQQLAALNAKKNIAATLTKHFDCLVCSKYSECLSANISPWTSSCVLSRTVNRKITRVRPVKES